MATIKYEVLRHNMRKDKTWNVVIRVTHKRVMKYIPTTVFVTRDELTSSFKIKNYEKLESVRTSFASTAGVSRRRTWSSTTCPLTNL